MRKDMKTKGTQHTDVASRRKSKGERLGWTPRCDSHKVNVPVMAKGEIVSASVCHISAPVQIVQ